MRGGEKMDSVSLQLSVKLTFCETHRQPQGQISTISGGGVKTGFEERQGKRGQGVSVTRAGP